MAQSPSDQLAEADRLVQQALQQCNANPDAALQLYQQALNIYRERSIRLTAWQKWLKGRRGIGSYQKVERHEKLKLPHNS